MNRLACLFVTVAALTFGSSISGCEYAPGLNQEFGYVIEYLPAPPDVVVPATRRAMAEMQWMIMSSNTSGPTTTIQARNTYDDRVLIKITDAPESSSEVAVKNEFSESEVLSREIIQKIRGQIMPLTK